MRARRGAESAGASANNRSRRKRPYVSGATTVRLEAVYKFVLIVAFPGTPNHLRPLSKSVYIQFSPQPFILFNSIVMYIFYTLI